MDHIQRRTLEQMLAEHAGALLQGSDDPLDPLYRLTDHCVAVLGLAGAGICLGDPSRELHFVTATDGRASRVDTHQLAVGDGPSHVAYRSGQLITMDDIDTDNRWPDYQQMCQHVGYRAVASIPLPVSGQQGETIGALSLYDTDPQPWTPDRTTIAALLANLATGYVVNCRPCDKSDWLDDQLRQTLASRSVVERAIGMLATDRHLDTHEVFGRLRDHARSTGRPIRDVATEVVEGKITL